MINVEQAPTGLTGNLPDPHHSDVTGAQLGMQLRSLRKELSLTLHDLARRSGVSLSTLSKIENAQVAPTFDTLLKAARGLGISFETLLAQSAPEPQALLPRRTNGRLIITRKNDAIGFSTSMYEYRVHANGLRRKYMTPLLMAVKARKAIDITSWSSHEGEEFIYILKGRIEIHTEFYDPVQLDQGDSAYIDSGMAHAFLNIGRGEALVASICHSDVLNGPGLMANVTTNKKSKI